MLIARVASRIPFWNSICTASEQPAYLGSDETVRYIKACMTRCSSRHSQLCSVPERSAFPTRILNLESKAIRLNQHNSTEGRYAALSHCWGGAQPLRLTQDSLEQFEIGIAWHALPEVFQDAIRVTRALDISHLWIDSICIIQDSQSDWEWEAARMGEYYRNAHLTIAASSSANSRQRFLKDRDEAWKPVDFHIQSPMDDGKAYAVRVQPLRAGTLNLITRPLSTRGWTFQENVISKRVVHFTNDYVIWECRGCVESDGRQYYASYEPLAGNFEGMNTDTDIYSGWHRMVEKYSQRHLTYATDKLPALSGIAAVYHDAIRSAYLAGLWRDNLLYDLLWRSE